jgi:hypothetical protein
MTSWPRLAGRAAWLIAGLASLAFAHDGPYILRGEQGWESVSVEDSAEGARRRAEPVATRGSVSVAAVGAVPSFDVTLRAESRPVPDSIKSAAKAPLFVVADTHGEYEILVAQLRKHGLVDAKLAWKYGRGRLVVLGDAFDRGPHHTEILWLLYKLEGEAARAGGGVHFVLGNHETMVMSGDLRYLHPKYLETTRVLGLASYSELFGPSTLLGQWLRSRATVLRIDDQLFLHAGISRALADSGMTLADINAAVRAILSGTAPANEVERQRAELLMGSLGPLWYRGYFPEQRSFPTASPQDVDRALEAFGVRRIFIGHTIVPAITALYGGRVIAVQVYPRRDEAGRASFESLLIRNGELWRAPLEGESERLAIAR